MILSFFRMLDSLKNVWIFTPPLCVLVGTVGNMLTLIAVTSKSSKKNSFIVYLGALAVADTASLYFVVINSWLFYGFDIDIMLTGISCKVLAFMLYTCKMFSSLLVATLSTDRMVCSCFPHKRDTIGTPKSALIIISSILAFVLVINVHELYGFELVSIENVTLCGYVDSNYASFFGTYFTWVDTTIYFTIPSIIIVVANILAVRAVIISTKRLSHLMNVEAVRIRVRTNRQMIIMAVAVSAAFFLFTSPVGIFVIVRPYIFDDTDVFYVSNDTDFALVTITNNLAYLNFAINFFLYFVSGRRFRKDLRAACTRQRNSPGVRIPYVISSLQAT